MNFPHIAVLLEDKFPSLSAIMNFSPYWSHMSVKIVQQQRIPEFSYYLYWTRRNKYDKEWDDVMPDSHSYVEIFNFLLSLMILWDRRIRNTQNFPGDPFNFQCFHLCIFDFLLPPRLWPTAYGTWLRNEFKNISNCEKWPKRSIKTEFWKKKNRKRKSKNNLIQ